jgi:4-hydroxy-2-oxoheptanedioate aldolase
VTAQHFNLKARLADKTKPFLFTWLTIPSALLASQVARLPIESVCLDMQHGMIGFSDAVGIIGAINNAGRAAVVRVLWNEPGLIGQCLDAGAAAIIAPMINSRKEAEALVRSAKYPPVGGRSWGGYTATQATGLTAAEYLAQANSMTQVFAMIETQAALDAVEDIASVPGLDGLFVGPSDLSIALSNGAELNKTSDKALKAMKRISAVAEKNGLVAGAFAGTTDIVKTYNAMGYTFMAAAVDIDLMQEGAAQFMKNLA